VSFSTGFATYSIIVLPIPKGIMDCSVVNSTTNANELFCFFTPSYSVEVSWSATRVADESLVKVASGIVAV